MRNKEISFRKPLSGGRRWPVLASALLAIAASCVGDNQPPSEPLDTELAELMDDGALPAGLEGADMTTPPPRPRSCFGGTSGPLMPLPIGTSSFFGSDGGVAVGFPGVSGTMPPPANMGIASPVAAEPASPGFDAGVPMPIGDEQPGPASDGGSPINFDGDTGGSEPDFDNGGIGPFFGDGSFDAGGAGGQDPSCASQPIAFWQFDDCNTSNTELSDSAVSFAQGHPAFRSVDVTCTADQTTGQATHLAGVEDIVYAPDQPDFSLADGVTIAAWIKPDELDGVRTLFRKRDDGTSAFALVLNDDSLQFVIHLSNRRFRSVSVPGIKAGNWTHVAATYDGQVAKVYLNGQQAAQRKVIGQLSRGAGPLLMGNDINGRRFQGDIDDVWFNTLAAPPDTILQLTCLPQLPTGTVTPMVSDAVQAGTPVTYQFVITNNNSASCQPITLQASAGGQPGFTVDPHFTMIGPIASGETNTTPVVVTSGDDTDPGPYPISFDAFSLDNIGGLVQEQAQYVVAEPIGCHVSSARELTIRDVSVVDDPIRTSLDGPADDPRTGAWTFGRLMQRLAPSDDKGPDVAENMLRSFLSPQTINTFNVDPRPNMNSLVLSRWPRTADGKLDLVRAPMRLLAIVNRLDLKDLTKNKAGEGRIVFGVLHPGGSPMEFTVIFEYLLPARSEDDFNAWANKFQALQALPFPSEDYNVALQAITDSFSMRGALASGVNGSSLIDVRTNEIALSAVWQLREFHLSPATGFLAPATLFDTPDSSFNRSDTLGQFINANEADIIAERFDVPATFNDMPLEAGAVFNRLDVWSAPGTNNPLARHKFSLNTCNGCHGGETNTQFLQIFPRVPGQPSRLAAFLTGEDVRDRFDGTLRHFNELGRRRTLLQAVVCGP